MVARPERQAKLEGHAVPEERVTPRGQAIPVVHDEPVDVVRSGDEPTQFLLDGRLFLIRTLLAHWTEPGGWRWSAPRPSDRPVQPGHAVRAGSVAGAGGLPVVDSVPVDVADREVWRVTAAAGRHAQLDVFDLSCQHGQPRWTASRVEG